MGNTAVNVGHHGYDIGCVEVAMRKALLAIVLVLVIGLGAAIPQFESSGSVRGQGIGQVQQVNPYDPVANYNYYGGWGNWFWEQFYYPVYYRYWGGW
jgi:hypothetical protein